MLYNIFLVALAIIHIVFAGIVQRRLWRSVHFEKTRVINSILLWLVPFLWGGLLFYLTKKQEKLEIITQDREKTIRENWHQPLSRSNWTSMN